MKLVKNFPSLMLGLLPVSFALGNAAIESIAVVIIGLAFYKHRTDYFEVLHSLAFKYFAIFVAVNSLVSLSHGFTEFVIALGYLRFMLLAVSVYLLISHERALLFPLFLGYSITIVVMSCSAIFQSIAEQDFFGNAIYDNGQYFRLTTPTGKLRVGYVLSLLLLPYIGYVADNFRRSRLFLAGAGVTILLGMVALFLSGERMPLLIVLTSVGVLGITVRALRSKVVALMIIKTLFVVLALYFSQKMFSRFIEVTGREVLHFSESSYGKLFLTALAIIKDNLFLGIGIDQFRNVCQAYVEQNPNFMCANHIHNLYLQLLAESGLIVVLFFGAALLAFARVHWQNFKQESYLVKCSVVLFWVKLIPLVSAPSAYSTWAWIPVWVAFGFTLLNNDPLTEKS